MIVNIVTSVEIYLRCYNDNKFSYFRNNIIKYVPIITQKL